MSANRPDGPDALDPAIWRVAAVVFIGPFMTQIDSTVVNVSLSSIGDALYAPIAMTQWVITGYLLALALTLPLNGWFVDRFGARRLYIGCFAAFTLASLLCGAAQTINQLIVARMLQGIAGGLLVPLAQMMIARVAGRHMARVMGYLVVPVLIAPILGPIVAAIILKHAGWPWLFYLNLPVGAVGVVLATYLLPADHQSTAPRRFDWIGFLLISPGLACLLFGLQQVAHGNGALLLVVGAVLMAGFVRHARRDTGLIDLSLFANKIFSAAAMTQFFSNGIFFARQFLVPLYLVVGCAIPAANASWMIAVMGLGMMCSFPLIGYLTGRYGCRAVSSGGALLAGLSMLPFPLMIAFHVEPVLVMVSLFLAGAGQGTISIPSVSAAYASVAQERLPAANTALNIVQRLGGPVITAAVAVAVSTTTQSTGPRAFMVPFLLVIVIHLCVLAAAIRLPAQIHHLAGRD